MYTLFEQAMNNNVALFIFFLPLSSLEPPTLLLLGRPYFRDRCSSALPARLTL